MLPDSCSVREKGKHCVNPPESIIEVLMGRDEYMIGVTCQRHKEAVSNKVSELQNQGKIPKGRIKFSPLKAVKTDCIRIDPEDLIQL